MRIEAIYISPVKSLALQRVERVHLGPHGIYEDRRFFLISDRDRLVSQREAASLTQVQAVYTREPELLRLIFLDGRVIEGTPLPGAPITARFFGKVDVAGALVEGAWSEALSAFIGMPVRLVKATKSAFDAAAVSICSTASVQAFRDHAGAVAVDERRFRPNFYISGVEAHGEDAWVGGELRVGPAARVHIVMRDPRCVITTHNPDTGEHDLNALRVIGDYRTDQPKEANFGVYGRVITPGDVAVGDELVPGEKEEAAS
jgi:uncharacterized protein YcbX